MKKRKNIRVTLKNQKQETADSVFQLIKIVFARKLHTALPRHTGLTKVIRKGRFFRPSGSSIKLELEMWPAHRDHKKSRVVSFLYKIVYVTYWRKNKFLADRPSKTKWLEKDTVNKKNAFELHERLHLLWIPITIRG